MKTLVSLILLLCLSIGTYSQTYEQRMDSLEFEIKKLEKNQMTIVNQLDLHQGRYFGGQILTFTGVGITVLSAILYSSTNNKRILTSGGLVGGACIVSGFFLSLNSFKFLRKDFDYYEYQRIKDEMNSTEGYEIKEKKKKSSLIKNALQQKDPVSVKDSS